MKSTPSCVTSWFLRIFVVVQFKFYIWPGQKSNNLSSCHLVLFHPFNELDRIFIPLTYSECCFHWQLIAKLRPKANTPHTGKRSERKTAETVRHQRLSYIHMRYTYITYIQLRTCDGRKTKTISNCRGKKNETKREKRKSTTTISREKDIRRHLFL